MTRRALLIASLIAFPLAATAAGFDAGDEGWTTPVAPLGGTQTWVASGGNGGGWLQVTDLNGGSDILISAPSAWLGNWSAFLGGTLSFDAKNANRISNDWPGFGEIVISGPAGTVQLDIVAANQPPTDDQWHHYSVALAPADGWSNPGSLASVLANVASLTINGEFHAGPGEVVGFDNIQVTAVPEPASAALLLAGVGLLAGLRRKR